MNENLGRGYVQIGKNRGDLRTANGLNHMSPPVDKNHTVYCNLFIAGVGFLLPYNSFIMAVDYFQDRYPGTTIMFDMSMVYIMMAFVAVFINNILVNLLSLRTRINFGYALSLSVLLFIASCELEWDTFSPQTAYKINLYAVGAVAVGCTIQQSSYYGFTSMLPSRYTQAVMAGESAAGFWVSVNRIITKYMLNDERQNTVVFFCMTIVMVAGSWVLHTLIINTPFVKFYLALCTESRKKIVLEPTEDAGLIDLDGSNEPGRSNYGILKLQTSPPPDSANSKTESNLEVHTDTGQRSAFSFANPVYEPSNNASVTIDEETINRISSGPSFKVEDVLVRVPIKSSIRSRTWNGIKSGLLDRWHVAQNIYPYMVTIGLAYFVTLSLYPGIESEIVSCRYKSWMPVIMMTIFNAADLFGKMLTSIPYEWSRSQLLTLGILRILLVPLMLLCAIPRESPHIKGEIYPMIFSLLLGLTNGIVGSVPMIQAPARMRDEHRELTGNIMTISYNIGLTTGTLVAYLLDSMLGPQVPNVCSVLKPTQTIFTRASTKALIATELTTIPVTIATTIGVISKTLLNATIATNNATTMRPSNSTISSLLNHLTAVTAQSSNMSIFNRS